MNESTLEKNHFYKASKEHQYFSKVLIFRYWNKRNDNSSGL